jgi:PAS domain S-box-containing protein
MTGLRAVLAAGGLSRLLARAARRRATPLQAVGLGLTAALAVLVLRWALSVAYGDAAGFMIFLPAVIVATLAAGPIAGMTALIACLAGGWVLVGATSGIDLFDHIRRVATTNFVLVGLFSAAVAAALRQAIRDLDAASAAQDAATRALDLGQSELRALLDQSSAGVARLNAEGRFVVANERFAAILGRAADDLIGLSPLDITHPDDVAVTIDLFARMQAGEPGGEIEKRYLTPDGSPVWCLASVRGLIAADGAPDGYVVVLVDVTPARRADAARAESEARFRLMADTAPSPVWMTDVEARVEFANRALVEFYGTPMDALLGHVWRAALHPDDVARVEAVQAAHRPGRLPYGFEARFRRADGAWRWMRCSVNPRFDVDGAFLGYVGMSFDVTEQRLALAEARESEERFRAIADTAPVLIWVTDRERRREFVNEAYVAYMGGDYETVRDADWRDYIHPDDQPGLVTASLAGEATRQPFSLEARYRRADGVYRWLKSFSRPRLDAHGEVAGFVGVAFDVTDAKQAEQDLKRLNELLEDRVGAALAEKAKAEADLMHAQRMEAVGRLTGGVAHDFNNLLTVVIGALDIILRSDDPARREKLGRAALSAARRGESLTHQLLAFSRRQALRPEPTDLNAQIQQSEPLLRRALAPGVALDLALAADAPRADIDPAQLEAALLNLVVNASDAVGEGGRVEVRTDTRRLAEGDDATLAPGLYVLLTVADDGAGMSADIVDRAFEPFFTTKPLGKGTGLGLSQVYGFCRQSGGDARIASEAGRGAEVTLWLPALAPDQAVAVVEEAESVTGLAGAGRVLLVEDDAAVATVAEELLQGLGYEVEVADSGEAALTALAAGAFDLMLTDVIMPGGMNGAELARRVAAEYPHMRLVLTSGYAGEDVAATLADAPWPFLRKPYSEAELARALRPAAAT